MQHRCGQRATRDGHRPRTSGNLLKSPIARDRRSPMLATSPTPQHLRSQPRADASSRAIRPKAHVRRSSASASFGPRRGGGASCVSVPVLYRSIGGRRRDRAHTGPSAELQRLHRALRPFDSARVPGSARTDCGTGAVQCRRPVPRALQRGARAPACRRSQAGDTSEGREPKERGELLRAELLGHLLETWRRGTCRFDGIPGPHDRNTTECNTTAATLVRSALEPEGSQPRVVLAQHETQ